jgi:hypothetical protein
VRENFRVETVLVLAPRGDTAEGVGTPFPGEFPGVDRTNAMLTAGGSRRDRVAAGDRLVRLSPSGAST